jgi:hypothetical protein
MSIERDILAHVERMEAQSRAARWEVAKGHLRACVAALGLTWNSADPSHIQEERRGQHDKFYKETEKFIRKVESESWHE